MKPTLPIIALLFLCIFAANYSYAATLTVTKTADTNDGVCDADCSLREAVAAAASGDTVVFSSLFNSPQTITLTLGQMNVTRNLTVTGIGPTFVDISANLAGRVFLISGGLNVTISGMKLRNGRVGMPDPGEAYGGAIAVNGNGSLALSDMEFTNNQALGNAPPFTLGEGSAVWCDGCTMTLANLNVHHNLGLGAAIQADNNAVITITKSIFDNNVGSVTVSGSVDIRETRFTGNRSGPSVSNLTLIDSEVIGNNGPGIPGYSMIIENSKISGNTEGGVSSSGDSEIRNTIISNNQCLGSGCGISNTGTMYVNDSTIIGNVARFDAGGIATSGSLFLTNSTVSGNIANGAFSTAGLGGGIYSTGSLTITNSTISNNQSKGGGGGTRQDSGQTATIRNTIIAGNTSTSTDEEDISGAVTSQGNNLIGDTFGSSGWIASDLLNVNPMLGPLADNGGGGTMTHVLLPGSPAINAGNNSVAIDPQTQMPLTTDQRAFLRFYGETVDIGAFEVQPVVSGSVIYGNVIGSPTPRYVSEVLLNAVGPTNVSATTSINGTYTLGGFGSGSYTVTPSKTDGANGISSFDSALVARHSAGIQVLTGNQLIVADVSGNGTVSSFDSAQIARYAAGLNSNLGASGTWIFIPASRTYSSINSSMTGQDFIALLMGDVSGSWQL